MTRDQMRDTVRKWQDNGLEVVFTNGCFDILHHGHIEYLEKARSLGDKLVVGVNADASVSKLKGPSRPINSETSRAYLLASLSFVDQVTVFAEDTPLELLTELVPDVLVKGGDYKAEEVVGGEVVREHGGRVEILAFKEGFSTTAIEDKILQLRNTRTS